MPTEPDHYQHIAEVKQVAWGGWKAGVFIFLLKLVAPLHSFLHHLAMAMADGSDDDITQVLFLVRETHPLRKAIFPRRPLPDFVYGVFGTDLRNAV